jgi:hypothetical protein
MPRTLALPHPSRAVIAIAVTLALAAASILLSPLGRADEAATAASRLNRAAFHDTMRVLWEDHIVWTRLAIIGIVDGRPDASFAVDRLLANQDDIGDAVKPFYGEAASETLAALLREHITGAAAVLEAVKAGGDGAAETAAWYANADAIAAFLSNANPRAWSIEMMTAMMRDHLDLTLDEAVARLTGDYAADVAAYDEIHRQILHMADMLSDGIIAQFPGSFMRGGS